MSTADTIRTVMVVSDVDDEEIRRCCADLANAGVPLDTVPDVYAATARLSRDAAVGKILVDIRTLDGREMTFLRLVPRFFPSSSVVVPRFSGVAERVASHAPGIQPMAVSSVIESIAAEYGATPYEPVEHPAETDERIEAPAEAQVLRNDRAAGDLENRPAPEPQPSPPLHRPLPADGGAGSIGAGPSLHDAVRERMAADESRANRRTPPRSPPGGQAPAVPPLPSASPPGSNARSDTPMLTPEEMDALLTGDEEDGGEPPRSGGDGGGAS